jgi:hypothetical protein|tara:strand:- start:4337 stop:4600 length:264 start_codon:yes stop_codon:yes gene_type:complete
MKKLDTKTRIHKKLWKGEYMDLRDYEIRDAIKRNVSIQNLFRGDTMTLSPSKLKEYDLTVGTKQISRYTGKEYKLISIRWRPDANNI